MTIKSLLTFLFLFKTSFTSNLYCQWSKITLERVQSCPTKEKDWILAADRKNCSMYARLQNCTKDIEQFQYHCAINEYKNETVEVCAPVRFIIDGFCTEFNMKGARIQPHYGIKCSIFPNPCPERYKSTESYKYPMCYEYVDPSSKITTFEGIYTTLRIYNSSSSSSGQSDDTSSITWIIVIIIVLVIIVLLLIITLILLRRRKLRYQQIGRKKLEDISMDKGKDVTAKETEREKLLHDTKYDIENVLTSGIEERELLISKERDETQSVISRESATDEIVVIRGEILLDMRKGMTDITAEDNIRESKKKIDLFKPFDSYFVEIGLVKATEEALKKNGVAILTGPPGCGKTSSAYHIMLGEFYKDWTIRIIRRYEEFTFLESGKNTFVYIDNFLDGFLCYDTLEKWLDIFTTIFYKHIRKTKRGFTTISGSGNVHLLITARENVFDRISKFMKQGRSPVFNTKCIVDARIAILSDEEKDAIFDSQIKYAYEIRNIGKPAEDEEFRKEIKQAEGPVGFPLCAHLFACKEEYRYTGPHFFSYPLKYFRTQIKHEIDADKTKKTMTLLLLLFLYESKGEDSDKSENIDLKNGEQCKRLLHRLITPKESSEFYSLDFEDLTNVAENLTSGILTGNKESGFYRFKHQTIREAVGNFFCTEYFETAMKLFPFEVLLSQNFCSCSIDQYIALTSRLILEIERGNVSMVFGCNAFKVDAFVKHFHCQLRTYNNRRLRRFLLISDVKSSCPLPAIFWISKYKLETLLESFLSMISERGIDVEIHQYLGLFGEICTIDENLQSKVDGKMSKNASEIKKVVFEYTDSEKNTILNIVIRSNRADVEAASTIKMLLKENKNIIKHANQHNETPVMLAVNCNKDRKQVLRELLHTDVSLKLTSKDEKGWTVFHHCISSNFKDKECVEYLQILLDSKLQRDLKSASDLGETALGLAAKHVKHSRVLSILSLIEDKDIDTIDTDGRTPIHSAVALLKTVGHDPYIELEIATRVSIFIIYGCNVGSMDDENFTATDICYKTHYDNIKRILALKSKNQTHLSEIIQNTLHQIERKSNAECVTIPNPKGLISPDMLKAIGCAAECLADIELNFL